MAQWNRCFSQRTKPPFMVGIFHGYVSHNQMVSCVNCVEHVMLTQRVESCWIWKKPRWEKLSVNVDSFQSELIFEVLFYHRVWSWAGENQCHSFLLCFIQRWQDVFAKYAETFEKIGVNANNGLGDMAKINEAQIGRANLGWSPRSRIPSRPQIQRKSVFSPRRDGSLWVCVIN